MPRHNAPFRPDRIIALKPQATGQLLSFLIEALPDVRRTVLKQMLAHNQVAVNGVPCKQFDTEISVDDEVKVNFTRDFRLFYHRRLQLVYEDDDIIVVNKGYGLLSMGNDKVSEGTAYSILKDYVKWQNPANKIFIVHRLDRDTSGLMLFAKSMEAKERLQHNWNNMVLNRKYLAVVEGAGTDDAGVVKSYLVENSKYEVYSSEQPVEGAKLAVTRYATIKRGGRFALLEVELDTGRKNQIRVHMKDIGHPISGDRKYGASASPIHRLALHAQTLRFVHPITRKEMNFTTPVPSSFLRLLTR